MDDKPAQGQPLPPLPTPIESGPNAPVAPLPPPAQPEPVPPPSQEPPPIASQPVEITAMESIIPDTALPLEMESAQIPPVPPPPPPPPASPYGGPPSSGEVSLIPESPPPPNPPLSTPAQGGKKILFIIIPLVVVVVLVLAFVVLRGKGESNVASTPSPTVAPTAVPTPIVNVAPLVLSLFTPKEGEIATASSIFVKGTTSPNSIIAFLTDKNFESTESGVTGSFSGNLKLSSGTNDILIVAVNSKGESKSDKRSVVFGVPTSSASASLLEATGSALIRGKMQAIPGIITGINGAIVTILDKSQNDTFYNLKVATASAIRLSGSEKAGISALSLGQAALAVATLDKEGNLVANLIHAVAK